MGERSNALAEQFEQAIAEFAEGVKAIPEEKWGAKGGNEGYTVAARRSTFPASSLFWRWSTSVRRPKASQCHRIAGTTSMA
jgi:hypothetical protein